MYGRREKLPYLASSYAPLHVLRRLGDIEIGSGVNARQDLELL